LSRVHNLLWAARAINKFISIDRILTRLHLEMFKCQQMDTFEAFCLFNEVKQYMELDSCEDQEPELKAPLEQLKAKVPICLRLILWPKEDENQLRLVNKFFDSAVCIRQEKIVCSSSSLDKELFFSAAVDPDTALTTFSFYSGTTYCKLDVAALEDFSGKKPWTGTQWKLKAHDENHVKIFTDDGERQLLCTY